MKWHLFHQIHVPNYHRKLNRSKIFSFSHGKKSIFMPPSLSVRSWIGSSKFVWTWCCSSSFSGSTSSSSSSFSGFTVSSSFSGIAFSSSCFSNFDSSSSSSFFSTFDLSSSFSCCLGFDSSIIFVGPCDHSSSRKRVCWKISLKKTTRYFLLTWFIPIINIIFFSIFIFFWTDFMCTF